jgi:hypothetical protein
MMRRLGRIAACVSSLLIDFDRAAAITVPIVPERR